MKPVLKIVLLSVVFVLCLSSIAFAFEDDSLVAGKSIEFADITLPALIEDAIVYDYPITPSSKDWAEATNDIDRLRSLLDIPENDVEEMLTKDLVVSVLEYPYLIDIFAFDSIEIGIQVVSDRFSGLRELLSREDAGKWLTEAFVEIEEIATATKQKEINYQIHMNYLFLRTLLTTDGMIAKLTPEEAQLAVEASNSYSRVVETASLELEIEEENNVQLRATYGVVYTPKGTGVTVEYFRTDWSYADKMALNAQTARDYPSATLLRDASNVYNCHAYAWHEEYPIFWMNNPGSYMSDGSYTFVGNTPSGTVKKLYYSLSGLQHTARVNSYSGTALSSVTVTSKWGTLGLYQHKANHCPYYISTTASSYYKYYR